MKYNCNPDEKDADNNGVEDEKPDQAYANSNNQNKQQNNNQLLNLRK